MSYKFDVGTSCFVNCFLVPLGLYENALIRSYILGMKEDNRYNELLTDPNVEQPRVEELDDEDKAEDSKVEEVEDEKDENTSDDDAVKVEKSDADDID